MILADIGIFARILLFKRAKIRKIYCKDLWKYVKIRLLILPVKQEKQNRTMV
jgi:hypothetical protein